MTRKGLLNRKISGAVPAKQTFDENKFEKDEQKSEELGSKQTKKTLNFANQKVSIKVGKDVKADLETIKITEKVKYDYETIQLLVDSYKNSLSPEDKKRYSIIHNTFAQY